jgi:serine/threonine-protein kinase RsbW
MYPFERQNRSEPPTLELGLEQNVRRVVLHGPGELSPIIQKLEDWMRVLGYPRKDVFAVALALREAVANAVRHGNRGDRTKKVRLSYLVTPEKVLIEVEDEGRGFDPESVPSSFMHGDAARPGCKRGLFLIRAYMSWVTFTPPGNRVMFGRPRSPA